MSEFEGFTREEVIKSGSDRIPCFEFLAEDYPCEDCACQSACSQGLSCQAFNTYLRPEKNKRMTWKFKLRIPTSFWFNRIK